MKRIFAVLLFLSFGWSSASIADTLDKYPGFTRDESLANKVNLIQARQEILVNDLVKSCMAEKGFEYRPSPSVTIESELTAEAAYELADLLSELEKEAMSVVPNDPTEYNLALYGRADPDNPYQSPDDVVLEDNCLDYAHERVHHIHKYSNKLSRKKTELKRKIANDHETRKLDKTWSICMKKEGYEYSDYREMIASFADHPLLDRQVERTDLENTSQSCFESAKYAKTIEKIAQKHRDEFARINKKTLVLSLKQMDRAEKQLKNAGYLD